MIHSKTEIRVRYAETDKMGIVYHGNYFTWLEIARIQMLDELNYPYLQLESEGYLLPVMEAQAKFIRPARFDDRLQLQLKITEPPSVRIKIDYELYRKDELLMTGRTTHAFMSPEGQAIRPPKELLKLMQQSFSPKN